MYELSKGCVKELIEGKEQKANANYLVQVTTIMGERAGEGIQKKGFSISDGVWNVKAISKAIPPDVKQFDVLQITTPIKISMIMNSRIFIIESCKLAFSGLTQKIGAPVNWPNPNPIETEIVTEIPITAENKLIAPIKAEKKSAEKMQDVGSTSTKKEGEAISFRPLKALSLFTSDWTVKVRVIKKSSKREFTRKSDNAKSSLLSLELIDAEGTKISSTLFGEAVEKFESILEENRCYYMSNGTVKTSNKRFTTIDNDLTLVFGDGSLIISAPDDGTIESSGYLYTPIEKIEKMEVGKQIDVLGVVKSVGKTYSVNLQSGGTAEKRTLTIFDESMQEIDVTLWKELASEEFTPGTIVGFKNVKINYYQKKQLSSLKDAIIVRDPDDKRCESIKKLVSMVNLEERVEEKKPISLIAEIKHLEEMADPGFKYFTVVVHHANINHDKGFYYMACTKCKKKMSGTMCEKCNEENKGNLAYSFNMRVNDCSGTMWVHAFSDQGEKIIGKTVEELKATKESDNTAFIKQIESPKTALFTLVIKRRVEAYGARDNYRYEIVKVLDRTIIEENKNLLRKLHSYEKKY